MKNLISLFLSFTLIYSCSDKESPIFSNQDKVQEYILPPNEIIVYIQWTATGIWVLTRDTVTQTVYFSKKSDVSSVNTFIFHN